MFTIKSQWSPVPCSSQEATGLPQAQTHSRSVNRTLPPDRHWLKREIPAQPPAGVAGREGPSCPTLVAALQAQPNKEQTSVQKLPGVGHWPPIPGQESPGRTMPFCTGQGLLCSRSHPLQREDRGPRTLCRRGCLSTAAKPSTPGHS